MRIGKFRQAFLDRFIERSLSPAEELLALCNAYQRSKQMRDAAIYTETEERFRHTLENSGYLQNCASRFKGYESRADEDFGDKRREFIYNKLYYADNLSI